MQSFDPMQVENPSAIFGQRFPSRAGCTRSPRRGRQPARCFWLRRLERPGTAGRN